jgi:Patatin-like phospholipase
MTSAPDTPQEEIKAVLVDDREVFRQEHIEISERRRSSPARVNAEDVKQLMPPVAGAKVTYSGLYDTIGLALSGGGIRSAAFATGAMQGLAKHGCMDMIDYLSTVSGGGYAGLATNISYAKNGKFAFFSEDEKKDTPEMAELRDRANYLRAGNFREMLINVSVYLRGIVANVIIVAPIILLLSAFTLYCNPDTTELAKPDFLGFPVPPIASFFSLTMYALIFTFAIFAVWALNTKRTADAGGSGNDPRNASYLLLVVAALAFLELQPFVLSLMVAKEAPLPTCTSGELTAQCAAKDSEGNARACSSEELVYSCQKTLKGKTIGEVKVSDDGVTKLLATVIGFLTALSAILSLLSGKLGAWFKSDEQKRGVFGVVWNFLQSRVLWWVAALALPVAFWLIYLQITYWGLRIAPSTAALRPPSYLSALSDWADMLPFGFQHIFLLYLIPGLVLLFLSTRLSDNGNSPHRLYRERLGAAFCFHRNDRALNKTDAFITCPEMKLSQLTGTGPYQLINAALNIAGDPAVNKRARDADFFLFSQKFVGSRATGYVQTPSMETYKSGKDLDVATAIAVSGAAFSSNMGSATLRLLRLTLAFFNVRLGYWFPNPKAVPDPPPVQLKKVRLYFLDEILGRLSSNSNKIYLTDGGHIENLGLYELLRRRCQLIIVVDGEADETLTFGSFVKAQRHARIDLGVTIHMKWSLISATSLAAQENSASPQAGPHCAVGTIDYEGGAKGYLLYIKSSVTGDENDYIRDYNRRYADFPHQTTADQFFSEEQFEVYRALGFHIADGAMSGTHFVQTQRDTLERLTDADAKGEGVAKVAQILRLPRKTFDVAAKEPEVHMIKLLSDPGHRLLAARRLKAKGKLK